MMLVFLSQISAAIAGFTLISRSRYMVSDQLEQMMKLYNYHDNNRQQMDWIQSKVSYVVCFVVRTINELLE